MDRDELIEKATVFLDEHPNIDVETAMADFALGMYEAGQRRSGSG